MTGIVNWFGYVVSSDLFRGSALFVMALSSIFVVILTLIKQRPIFHGQKLDARKSLDESVDRELKRLSAEIGAVTKRHEKCEEELDLLRSCDLSKARKIGALERRIDGFRRQLQAIEEDRVIRLHDVPPATALRFKSPDAAPVPREPKKLARPVKLKKEV